MKKTYTSKAKRLKASTALTLKQILGGNEVVDTKLLLEVDRRASDYFEKILSLAEINVQLKNKKPYEDAKNVFRTVITLQCIKDKIPIYKNITFKELLNNRQFEESLLNSIDTVINFYAAPMVFLLHLLNPKIVKLIDHKNKIYKKYLVKKERADIMTGKKLTKEKKGFYLDILEKKKNLINEYGSSSQAASLTNAVRKFDKTTSEKKVKAIAESIRYHQRVGNLPK